MKLMKLLRKAYRMQIYSTSNNLAEKEKVVELSPQERDAYKVRSSSRGQEQGKSS